MHNQRVGEKLLTLIAFVRFASKSAEYVSFYVYKIVLVLFGSWGAKQFELDVLVLVTIYK